MARNVLLLGATSGIGLLYCWRRMQSMAIMF